MKLLGAGGPHIDLGRPPGPQPSILSAKSSLRSTHPRLPCCRSWIPRSRRPKSVGCCWGKSSGDNCCCGQTRWNYSARLMQGGSRVATNAELLAAEDVASLAMFAFCLLSLSLVIVVTFPHLWLYGFRPTSPTIFGREHFEDS